MPDRPPFPIPETIDPPQFCLKICVPDDPIWKQVIAGLLFQPAEWFNWQRDDAKSGKELAQVWRKIYNEIDWSNMSCCPDDEPKQTRYTEEGHYQTSTDGGVTWVDAPTEDPRYSVPLAPPYLPPDTISEQCTYADSIVELFKSQFVDSVETAATIRDILAIIAGVVSAILGAFAAPLVYVIYAALAPAIVAFGVAAWQEQFTDEVWDRLRCNLKDNMLGDGSFDQDGVDAIYERIGVEESGLAQYTLRVVIATAGPNGLTNAARAGYGAADADCDACDECDTVTPNNSGYSITTGFDDSTCIWSFDAVINPSGAPGASPYVMGIDFGAGHAHVHLYSNSALGGYGYGWFPHGGGSELQGLTYPQDTDVDYWYAGGSGPFSVQLIITP